MLWIFLHAGSALSWFSFVFVLLSFHLNWLSAYSANTFFIWKFKTNIFIFKVFSPQTVVANNNALLHILQFCLLPYCCCMWQFIAGDIVVAHEVAKFICCVILNGIVCFKMEISFWILLALNKWDQPSQFCLQPLRHFSYPEACTLIFNFSSINRIVAYLWNRKKERKIAISKVMTVE